MPFVRDGIMYLHVPVSLYIAPRRGYRVIRNPLRSPKFSSFGYLEGLRFLGRLPLFGYPLPFGIS